jgi:DNA polymerase-3 subunit epsilon/oligoribonuclease
MIGIFLDIESNGLNAMKHRVIEIAFKFIDLQFQKEIESYSTIVKQSENIWGKSDPKSLKINGFTFEMLKKGKNEERVSKEILSLFKKRDIQRGKAVYICQNPSFDRSFFSQLIDPLIQEKNLWPYHWLDLASMFWALTLQKNRNEKSPPPWELGISKNKIAKALHLEEESLPHKAMQGVDHLIKCYFALNAD